mmetsp:Transcript_9739/g.23785  ORF Transcript_9739/g.23785 Transcript_9739/m.23785 type:complete len:131 (+) Transcript_9739:114-506(+)
MEHTTIKQRGGEGGERIHLCWVLYVSTQASWVDWLCLSVSTTTHTHKAGWQKREMDGFTETDRDGDMHSASFRPTSVHLSVWRLSLIPFLAAGGPPIGARKPLDHPEENCTRPSTDRKEFASFLDPFYKT